MCASVLDLDVYKMLKKSMDKFRQTHLDWSPKSQKFNVVTDSCDEVIFHNISHGASHTSMFTRTVPTPEDINFLTGEIHKKNKVTVVKPTLPYHLESKTHIYHAS